MKKQLRSLLVKLIIWLEGKAPANVYVGATRKEQKLGLNVTTKEGAVYKVILFFPRVEEGGLPHSHYSQDVYIEALNEYGEKVLISPATSTLELV